MEPVKIELMPNDLAILWQDEHETFVDYVTLRNACPCASCKGESHLWGKTPPTMDSGNLSEEAYTAVDFKVVGHYGLSLIWADRHDSGIFTYEQILSLCQCEKCTNERQGKVTI